MKQVKADQLLVIAAIGLLIPLGLLSSSEPSTQALVWVLAAAAILFRSTICLLLMLLSLFVGYYILSRNSSDDLGIADVLLAVVTVSFLSLALRYIKMTSQSMASTFWIKLAEKDTPPPTSSFHKQYFRPWAGFAFSISISIMVALILFAVLPTWRFENNSYRIVAPVLRMITMFWLLGSSGVAVHTFFSFIRNRNMGQQQAKLLALRTFDDELGREQTAIEKRASKV